MLAVESRALDWDARVQRGRCHRRARLRTRAIEWRLHTNKESLSHRLVEARKKREAMNPASLYDLPRFLERS